ncbi:hypothetical protein ABRY75_19515 [Bacillus stercoris]
MLGEREAQCHTYIKADESGIESPVASSLEIAASVSHQTLP